MAPDPIAEFWRLSREATEHVGRTFNAPDVIPYGKQIVDLIRHHDDRRDEFVNAFVEASDLPNKCDRWLIEFCMHALRFPEAKQKFEALCRNAVAANDWNRIQPLQHILDAFEDDWEDAEDIYVTYFQKHI